MSCCVITVLKKSERLSGLHSTLPVFSLYYYLIGAEAGGPKLALVRNRAVIGRAKHRVDYGAGCLMGRNQKNARSISRIKNGQSEGHLDSASTTQNCVPTRSIKMF